MATPALSALLSLLLLFDAGDTHIRKGDDAYRDFRTRDAIAFYTEAYDNDPRDFHALVRLSRAWSDLGRLTLRRSDSSESFYRTGLEYARQLVEAHPDSAVSWFMLALCHGSLTPFKSLGEKLDIAQDVEKNALHALELDPDYSMPYVLLGIYYRGVSRLSWIERTIVNGILGKDIYGTLEDAEQKLRRAVELDPGNSFAYFELSSTYRSMGRDAEAAETLRKVLDVEPANERERQQFESAKHRLERMAAGSTGR